MGKCCIQNHDRNLRFLQSFIYDINITYCCFNDRLFKEGVAMQKGETIWFIRNGLVKKGTIQGFTVLNRSDTNELYVDCHKSCH